MHNRRYTIVAVDRTPWGQDVDTPAKKPRDLAGRDLGGHDLLPEDESSKKIQAYDFRRPDRIAKDQLRAIHVLHENFARSLASSLSAYLRAYVAVNLVSVEQLSFMEFAGCLPSPTSIVTLGMKPVDGSAVLEINPSLVFPILEMLLGGSGKLGADVTREVTEIEQSILEGLLHVILHDLRASWHAVTALDFSIDSHETEPQLLQILAPNEAVVAISLEVRIGDRAGMMNIGIPSIVVKVLRQKFDQQWSVRKTQATEEERARVLRLIRPAIFQTDVRLHGPTLSVGELLALSEGDILAFDYPLAKPVDLLVNGKLKYRGDVVATTRKLAFEVSELVIEE